MSEAKFDICSTALTMIGCSPIASFEDGSAEADVARTHYESVLRGALTVPGAQPYRWRFASDLRSLGAPLSGVPTAKWGFAWQLPADMLALTGVYVNDRAIPYARFADKLLCDEAEGVVAEITYRPDEAAFPPYFVTAFTHELASRFAPALAQDTADGKRLFEMAVGFYTGARTLDSQQQPPKRVAPGRLLNAWR